MQNLNDLFAAEPLTSDFMRIELRNLCNILGNSHDLIYDAVRNLPEEYRVKGQSICCLIKSLKSEIQGVCHD